MAYPWLLDYWITRVYNIPIVRYYTGLHKFSNSSFYSIAQGRQKLVREHMLSGIAKPDQVKQGKGWN